ncbi:YgiQ family radical SAM protein [bacterium]|nr:YgiQ family radical SAM protein [bacterium]
MKKYAEREKFLPTQIEDLRRLDWKACDIIIITGDTYIDSPFIGAAVISRWLEAHGFKVGIIAQPDVKSDDIARLGEPRLFWGVTGGCMDSMVANYTAMNKFRNQDDLTPGGKNIHRPDRASMVYTNLIRRHFKDTRPIVLGGVEASLRRIAHYDFWSNKIRRSILFDAKADILVYGNGEQAILDVAEGLRENIPIDNIPGTCFIKREVPEAYTHLPSFEDASTNPDVFIKMFRKFYNNQDPVTAKGLVQAHGDRYLIHNPPAPPLNQEDFDKAGELRFTRDVHPDDIKHGKVRAQDTIQFSIPVHRGCYGECRFCSIAVHQGRRIQSRSEASVLREVMKVCAHPAFKGTINDAGGPTANMYGFDCGRKKTKGSCQDKACLYPDVCTSLPVNHEPHKQLLRKIRNLDTVKHVFVASGLRHDMILADGQRGEAYLETLLRFHTSGQLKIAPEHSEDSVLRSMGKPGRKSLMRFKDLFDKLNKNIGKQQFLSYYFIAAYPGCSDQDMSALGRFAKNQLNVQPEQVQIFTPLPCTWASVMYWTGKDPFTGKEINVIRDKRQKERQKGKMVTLDHSAHKAHGKQHPDPSRKFENKKPRRR